MMKGRRPQQEEQDAYAQLASGIGALCIVFGTLAAIKDKLGLSWPATVLLFAGVFIALGYGAWRLRTVVGRLRTRHAAPVPLPRQGPPDAVLQGPDRSLAGGALQEQPVAAHGELTAALTTAGAIGPDQIIRADEATVTAVQTGTVYDFLMPAGRTYEDVERRLSAVAGTFGVTRLHMRLERSRESERRVRLLKLSEPPFTRSFPAPTRQRIESFAGVPLGHDVTGELVGVESFSTASLLVAGMTQTGKTTLVNGLVTCLLIAYGDFQLYLLDGKFCGLTRFEKVAARYESSDDPDVFEAMVDELNSRSDRRYTRRMEAIRNRKPAPNFTPVIFIVDEAADFFAHDESTKGKERSRRIAEKTRSLVSKSLEAGIATVLMTQRPSHNAIPVMVRDQFQYRLCLYVASAGTAKVALGDTYFETIAPINPALLDPDIKGQGVLFAKGRSTLIRGFHFSDDFIWAVVDEVRARKNNNPKLEKRVQTPLQQAISLLQERGSNFMPTAELAPALGITDPRPVPRGKLLSKLLGVPPGKDSAGARGYWLDDLLAAARTDS
ncbi:FtsK/SpoIIIE domain-containing protein [Streptomyces roseolilacinus]|uniref:FtsK/SpoIIIE domain-containing protein n=1 Tax=Streptomyces roseolilacinus TaxID=66904 RepID=UPI00382C1D8D